MAIPRPIAYNVLGVDSEEDKGAVEFMDMLLRIEENLHELEDEVARYSLDLTGFRDISEIDGFDQDLAELIEDVSASRDALISHNWSHPDRYNSGYHTSTRTNNRAIKHIHTYRSQIERLERISDRVGSRITSKRNAANTRTVAAFSALAVVLSLVSIVVTVWLAI